MDLIKAIEIFAFVTGIIYLILEIKQKNFMWVIGILTGVACAYSFGVQRLWASMGLNIYYVVVSVWGLYKWRKDSAKLDDGTEVHLAVLSKKTMLVSALIFVLGTALMVWLLHALGDSSTILDAVVTVMSAIATWWLAKSYPQQWLLWILADALSFALCLTSGMYWMAVLYLAYAASAVYGWYYWRKKGKYVA